MQEQFEGDALSMKTKTMLRALGFTLLGLIICAIGYMFYSPGILVGAVGIFYPIGLFVLLLMAFFLLITSTRY